MIKYVKYSMLLCVILLYQKPYSTHKIHEYKTHNSLCIHNVLKILELKEQSPYLILLSVFA